MKLTIARVEYVLIGAEDQHTHQSARKPGSLVVAGEGHPGLMASLMEELHAADGTVEVTAVHNIRDSVIFHSPELIIPAGQIREVMADSKKPRGKAVGARSNVRPKAERLCASAEGGIVCGEPESAHTLEAARMDVGMDHKFEPGEETAT